MEANTAAFSNISSASPSVARERTINLGDSALASGPALVDRVIDTLAVLDASDVWARGAGRHVLLGTGGRHPFARLTALGGDSYGLSFQSDERGKHWQLLLVDDLAAIVEHALVACTVDRT